MHPPSASTQADGLRVLILSLEFLGPVFSGNGQYCRSIVRALKGHGARVFVVSGRKSDVPMEAQDEEGRSHAADPRHGAFDIPLSTWQRLDRQSGWQELAAGASSDACVAAVSAFDPQVVLCVDWTSVHAWLGLKGRLEVKWRSAAVQSSAAAPGAASTPGISNTASKPSIPSLYLNFRVFASSFPGGAANGGAAADGAEAGHGGPALPSIPAVETLSAAEAASALSPLDDRGFYCAMEGAAVRACTASVALCRQDCLVLLALACGVDIGGLPSIAGAAGNAAPTAAGSVAAISTADAGVPASSAARLWAAGCGASHASEAWARSLLGSDGSSAKQGGPDGTHGAAGASVTPAASGLPRASTVLRIVMPPLRDPIYRLAVGQGGASSGAGATTGAGSASTSSATDPSSASSTAAPSFAIGSLPGHRHITSAVRLSSEKGPHRLGSLFAAVQAEAPGLLAAARLQPLICGNGPEKEYVAGVLQGVREACGLDGDGMTSATNSAGQDNSIASAIVAHQPTPPPIHISQFIGPAELAAVFGATALNVHPALADAYGMTVVEAAALGAPSLVHVPGWRLPAEVAGGAAASNAGAAGAAGSSATPVASACVPPSSLFGPFPDKARPGYLRTDLGPLLGRAGSADVAADGVKTDVPSLAVALGAAALASASNLPPVGCCDLLAPQPDDLRSTAVVPVDFAAPPAEQARQLVPWLRGLVSEGQGGSAQADGGASAASTTALSLAAVAVRARTRALAWTEAENGAALLHAIRQVL